MAPAQHPEPTDRRGLLLGSSGVPQTAASAATVTDLGVPEATDTLAALLNAGQIVGACLTCRRGSTASPAYQVFGQWQLNGVGPHAAMYAEDYIRDTIDDLARAPSPAGSTTATPGSSW